MLVVGWVELVLDDDRVLAVGGDDVDLERADTLLDAYEFQRHVDGLTEQVEVLLPGQPRREVARLVKPVVPDLRAFQPPESRRLRRGDDRPGRGAVRRRHGRGSECRYGRGGLHLSRG